MRRFTLLPFQINHFHGLTMHIQMNNSLEQLLLSSNKISDEGAHAFAEALKVPYLDAVACLMCVERFVKSNPSLYPVLL